MTVLEGVALLAATVIGWGVIRLEMGWRDERIAKLEQDMTSLYKRVVELEQREP